MSDRKILNPVIEHLVSDSGELVVWSSNLFLLIGSYKIVLVRPLPNRQLLTSHYSSDCLTLARVRSGQEKSLKNMLVVGNWPC